MTLVRVYPIHPAFRARCLGCGTEHDSRDLWADLDGKAFLAYYCNHCASERGALEETCRPS